MQISTCTPSQVFALVSQRRPRNGDCWTLRRIRGGLLPENDAAACKSRDEANVTRGEQAGSRCLEKTAGSDVSLGPQKDGCGKRGDLARRTFERT